MIVRRLYHLRGFDAQVRFEIRCAGDDTLVPTTNFIYASLMRAFHLRLNI